MIQKNSSYTVYRHISPSNKVYVGITKLPPNERWRNGHGYLYSRNNLFINAIKKYGWNNIKHEILLEGISKKEAFYAEKYLIKWYKTHELSYNITDGGDIGGSLVGINHPMYGKHETNPMYNIRGGDNPNAIKVYQYDRNGRFVKAWNSIIEAAATFDNKSSAATGITACCKYKLPACKNYIWRYFYREYLNECAPAHTKHIYQYDINGNLIAEYNQINEVQKNIGTSKEGLGIISNCCKGKAVSGLGYFWSLQKYDKYPTQSIKKQVFTKMRKYLEQKHKDDVRLKEKQIAKTSSSKK